MNRTVKLSLSAAIAAMSLSLVGCGGNGPAGNQGTPAMQGRIELQMNPSNTILGTVVDNLLIPDTTSPQAPGLAHTDHIILNGRSKVREAVFTGYTPAQMRPCYGISSSGQGTICIVDAYNDQYALADFNAFSAQYGLPQETSSNVTSSSNQHFQIVYGNGSKPANNSGWSQEESLDIEWTHAMAPNAKIVLVEAANNSNTNLYNAENVAATQANVHEVSNSWGGGESSGETGTDSYFSHSGVVYFASGGDSGGVKEYPALSKNVVGCGGTTLSLNGSNGRSSETAWSGTGCGLSTYEAAVSWQSGISGLSSHRGADDIAAVADPNTGVSVHWNGGWYIFGGTSVACPMIAGMVNDSASNRSGASAENTQIYSKRGTGSLFDVTSGKAGSFSAGAGWDYPTGCGTPNGTSAF